MLKLGAANISTTPKPGTTTTATTEFARVAGAALGTCGARLSVGSGGSGGASNSGVADSSGGSGDYEKRKNDLCTKGNMGV